MPQAACIVQEDVSGQRDIEILEEVSSSDMIIKEEEVEMREMMDNLLKYFLVLVVMLPVGMLFHDSLWLKLAAVVYIFGLWWLVRGKDEKEQGNP